MELDTCSRAHDLVLTCRAWPQAQVKLAVLCHSHAALGEAQNSCTLSLLYIVVYALQV